MIGIIMLNTRFPRNAGDIGNPETFPMPVIYERVDQALVSNVISSDPLTEQVSLACIDAAKKLEALGATTIGTSCGFLAPEQSKLQAAVACPVLSSSLLLIPFLRGLYGHPAQIGVLTFDADQLSARHFNGSFDNNVLVQGLPKKGELYRTIRHDETTLDVDQAASDVTAAAHTLLSQAPDVSVLLLECTNLSPFKQDLKQKFRLPVFDLVDALIWVDTASPRVA